MSDTTEASSKSRVSAYPIVLFALKTAIVVAAVTFGMMLVIDQIVSDVDDMISRQVANVRYAFIQSGQLGETGTLTRIEATLDRAVALSNTVPAERQQKLLDDIRILAGRARPFVLAAESAFVEPAEASPQAAPQKDK